ncbi:hypothetical protein D9M68_758590 [compost metagenome]
MGAGDQHHQLFGIAAPKIGNVGRKPLSLRAVQRVQVFNQAGASGARGGEKPGAQGREIAGEKTGRR